MVRLNCAAKGRKTVRKVLVLEDEENIRSFVVINLKRAGYQTIEAATGEDALVALKENPGIKVALLDIMLPGIDGFEVCRRIRAMDNKIGIIMLTARTQEMDKVTGLMTGADDYVTKPFSPRELVARIRAVIRRKGGDALPDTLRVGPLEIDAERYEARVNGKPLRLSAVEFKFLQVFAKHPGRVYSRAQLIDKVWGVGADIDERTVDVHMLRLRKQLAGTAAADFIETVRGVGYRASNLKA